MERKSKDLVTSFCTDSCRKYWSQQNGTAAQKQSSRQKHQSEKYTKPGEESAGKEKLYQDGDQTNGAVKCTKK